MTLDSDLILPFSQLDFADDARATARDVPADHTVIAGLLQHVITAHAASLTDGVEVTLVSVTIDVTGPVPSGVEATFQSKLDRKTRTLIFIGGEATHAGGPMIKATAVYRIG